ncbi:MAG: T9SS type A sorting domain-containing protein [Bacteroidales bacterium]|nr:T9SS type A sorting domain-containing protein [Bacteroidales bacterium]
MGYNNQGGQTADLWLRKIDFNGNLIWQKCYGGSGDDFPLQLLKTSDGNLVVFGQTGSRNGDVTGIHANPPYLYPLSEDVWMLKVNGTNGNLLWNRCIGSVEREFINNGVVQVNDKDYMLAVNTIFGNNGDINCYDPEKEHYVWVSSIKDTTNYIGITELLDLDNLINIWPNPADNHVTIELSRRFEGTETKAELFDYTGKHRMSQMLTGQQPILTMGTLRSGMYILKLNYHG